jgi:hypothetical protein
MMIEQDYYWNLKSEREGEGKDKIMKYIKEHNDWEWERERERERETSYFV